MQSVEQQLKERGPESHVSRTTYFSKLQQIREPSKVAQNYRVGLQGEQRKTGPLSSTSP